MLIRDRGDAGPQGGGGAGGGLRAGSGGEWRRSGRGAQGLDVAGQGLPGVKRRQPQLPAHARSEGADRAGDRDRAGPVYRSRQGQSERPPGDAAPRGGRGLGRNNGALPGRQDDLGVRDYGEIAVIHLADRGVDGLSRGRADHDLRPAVQRARGLGDIAENDIPGPFPHSLVRVARDGVRHANAQVGSLAWGRGGRGGGARKGGRPGRGRARGKDHEGHGSRNRPQNRGRLERASGHGRSTSGGLVRLAGGRPRNGQ